MVGPNANNRIALQGNYHGTSSRYVTVLEGIQKEAEEDCRVLYAEGSHMYKDVMENLAWNDDRISEAVITAKHSDVTVVVLGLDETMEGEEPDQSNRGQAGDKASLELPGCQQRLLQAVVAVGKPVITVILSGRCEYQCGFTGVVSWRRGWNCGGRYSFWKGITKRKASGYIL